MHIGRSYKLLEFLDWTRRDVYALTLLGIVPVVVYQIGNLKWLGIPWTDQMRAARPWESAGKAHNAEYGRRYSVPEKEASLESELAKYVSQEELKQTLAARDKATHLMGRQSKTLKELFAGQEIVVLQFVDMQRSLKDLLLQQGKSERIKDFPYPRQFATINVWLVIPFSALISWMYTSLERVGESTESPFEGNANDVPISQMCRTVEVDLREMLGETDLPPLLQAKNNIVL